jgi:hypothetical protein
MRRHARRAITALVASVGLVVAFAPVASAKTVDVDEWAEGFCNAVEDWQTTALKAHDLVDDVIENGVSSKALAKSAQKKIVDALAAASKKSTSASKAVKALGTPDVPNGAEISTTIVTGIGDTAEAFGDAKGDVAKASTDPKKFRAKVKTISAQVDKDLEKAGEGISEIDALDTGGELDDAFNAAPACSFLANG